jgi:hypothetical protein
MKESSTNNATVKHMGITEFTDFSALCVQHSEIFSMASSPTKAQLESFYDKFENSPYIQGLFRHGQLEQAISALEDGYRNFYMPGVYDLLDSQLKEQKKLERRVRFIHRFAKLIGPANRPIPYFSPSEQRKRRKQSVKSLTLALQNLAWIEKDEFFQECLRANDHDLLEGLKKNIDSAARIIEEANPVYPIKRVRDENIASAKTLINRLADVCYRIYGYCDESIINHLTSYPWLRSIDEIFKIQSLIDEALKRKVNAFNRRLPNEDNESVSLLEGEWTPARTLDPPWMEA